MCIMDTHDLSWRSLNLEHTRSLGVCLGQALRGGELICLSGDLGAGKTALAYGIGQGWGALEVVHSPTFVFVHEHRRAADRMRLYHLDCYRLTSPEDAYSIGLEEMLAGDDPLLLEWAERIAPLLPEDALWIRLEADPADEGARTLQFRAKGSSALRLLKVVQGWISTAHSMTRKNDAAGD